VWFELDFLLLLFMRNSSFVSRHSINGYKWTLNQKNIKRLVVDVHLSLINPSCHQIDSICNLFSLQLQLDSFFIIVNNKTNIMKRFLYLLHHHHHHHHNMLNTIKMYNNNIFNFCKRRVKRVEARVLKARKYIKS
jgi:hypothetical protein